MQVTTFLFERTTRYFRLPGSLKPTKPWNYSRRLLGFGGFHTNGKTRIFLKATFYYARLWNGSGLALRAKYLKPV
jgi:hypothetical protein